MVMSIKNAGDGLSPAGVVDGCLRQGIIAEGERRGLLIHLFTDNTFFILKQYSSIVVEIKMAKN